MGPRVYPRAGCSCLASAAELGSDRHRLQSPHWADPEAQPSRDEPEKRCRDEHQVVVAEHVVEEPTTVRCEPGANHVAEEDPAKDATNRRAAEARRGQP